MASNHTQHFALNRWDLNDQIIMEDFNDDNAKIDAALKANADAISALQTAVGTGGKTARIAYGSYQGDGQYGPSHPNSLQFDFTPVFVYVAENDNHQKSPMLRGCTETNSTYGDKITLVWTDHGVSWYTSTDVTNPQLNQNNQENVMYYWLAIGY